jgi:ferritin-like metal-binding protein YciE
VTTPIRTPNELFAHRLRTMLWVEERLAEEILPTLYDHVHAVDLKLGIERHIVETQGHVRTVRSALHLLGTSEHPEASAALLGLKAEHDALMELVDQEREDVVDLMHADVIAQGEHHEIAAYTQLVSTAQALGEEEIAAMLQEILEQEEYALELAEKAAAKLLAEKVESPRLG